MTARPENSRRIDEDAALWVARIDRAPLSPGEQRELDEWLAGDVRRRGAFAKANAVMAHADRARALAAWPALGPPARQGFSRRAMFMGGGAMAASLGAVAWLSKAPAVRPILLRTAKGEIRLLPLSDGSSVTLNTNSVLEVAYSASRRDVALMSGEALFDVAKDRQRPFVVRAGDTRVRAVGTSFSVRLEETGAVRVLVREGVVEVTRGGRTVPVRASANVLAEVPPSFGGGGAGVSTRMVGADATARNLAWRDGMLSFNGESLAEAAAEFDRYSSVRIVIDDPDLSRQTLTGLFSASDPQGFAKAVASALNGKVNQSGNEVHIYR
jgi:transmembrane sensor